MRPAWVVALVFVLASVAVGLAVPRTGAASKPSGHPGSAAPRDGREVTNPPLAAPVPRPAEADTVPEDTRRRLAAECVPPDVAAQAGSVLLVGLSDVVAASHPLVTKLAGLRVGGVVVNHTNLAGRRQAATLVAGLRARLGPGVIVALDEEGGRVTSLGRLGVAGPSARRLGKRPADIDAAAGRLGQVAGNLGVNLVLSPVADLDGGPAWGTIGDRSFGTDPVAVGEAARRFAAAVRQHGVGSTAKHFPGHAGTQDPHVGPVRSAMPHDELLRVNVAAFRPLLADGVEAVMVGHVAYDALGPLPASLNPEAYRLLRAEGYTGPAITDALGMGAVHRRWNFDRSSVMALAAGADILLTNQGHEAVRMRDAIVAAVDDGTLPASRLREAAIRASTLRPGCAQAARVLL